MATKSNTFWVKSYDFLGSNSHSILSEFPLGPATAFDSDKQDIFFKHDGGEIVFSLPNGLQGYLLVTKAGDRIDAGPIEIVGDALKTSGTQAIINGLSCIACHRRGIVEPPNDELRSTAASFGEYASRIKRLYPLSEEMRKHLEHDTKRFESALQELVEPILIQVEDQSATLDSLPEPIGETARYYTLEPMTIETVASDLFHPSTEVLRMLVQNNSHARRLGLEQLCKQNGTIKREVWHELQGRSLMQIASNLFGFAPMQSPDVQK